MGTGTIFDISTHNMVLTITSRGGKERGCTIKIATQKDDASFMPGQRIVYMLSSSDKRPHYKSFAIIQGNKVCLWRRYALNRRWVWFRTFLEDPGGFEDLVTWEIEGRCRRCNRKLTTPASIKAGIGPVCKDREETNEVSDPQVKAATIALQTFFENYRIFDTGGGPSNE